MNGEQQLFGNQNAAQQTQTTPEMDYGKVYDNLSAGNFFKPKSGIPYEVVFLDGGGPIYMKAFKPTEEPKPRQDFKVKVKGGDYKEQELTWTQSVGGKVGLYGMLTALFAAWQKDGKRVSGGVIHIGCTGDGKDRKYRILEYDELQAKLMFAQAAK